MHFGSAQNMSCFMKKENSFVKHRLWEQRNRLENRTFATARSASTFNDEFIFEQFNRGDFIDRGIGRSCGIKCLDPFKPVFAQVSPTPASKFVKSRRKVHCSKIQH